MFGNAGPPRAANRAFIDLEDRACFGYVLCPYRIRCASEPDVRVRGHLHFDDVFLACVYVCLDASCSYDRAVAVQTPQLEIPFPLCKQTDGPLSAIGEM